MSGSILHSEVIMSPLGPEMKCYGLNAKFPHRLIYLDTFGEVWGLSEDKATGGSLQARGSIG